MAIPRGIVQRRPPARPTAAATRPAHSADSPRAQTAHPQSFWAFTTAPDAASDRTIRRLLWIAAQCSAVTPSLCTAGPGCGGGPHGGTPVPKLVPEHKTAGSPRGSTMVWVTVNDREYSERTRSSRHLAPRSRIHPNVPNFRESRKRRLRAKEAARNYETRQDGRGAYESRNVTSTPARTSACMQHRNSLTGA